MKRLGFNRWAPAIGITTLALSLAGCVKPALTPEAPPLVVIPPQPRPPRGAPPNLVVPPPDALGARRTINTGISPTQTVWNLRSAYNVAALNCLKPEHAAILDGYKRFLKTNARQLTAVNREMDKEFRARSGAGYVRAREAYMTQVYNYYALPPTLPAFCDAVLAVSLASATVPAKELESFAAVNLPRLDAIFLQFYDSYDQYRADLAAWRERYAPAPPPTVPTTALLPESAPPPGWDKRN